MQKAMLNTTGRAVLLGFLVLIIGNLLSFIVLYADTFSPLELPYTETFDENYRIMLRQHGGTWVVRDGAMLQTNEAGTDLMNVVPLDISVDENYQIQVDMRFIRGRTGGGLMFNMQTRDSRRQSHLVRFGTGDDGQAYLVYGGFDENFDFVTQGVQALELETNETLKIQVHDNTYDIIVDEQIIAQDVELKYFGGYTALSSWFSMVAFDNLSITPLERSDGVVDIQTQPLSQPTPQTVIQQDTYFYDDFSQDLLNQRWIPITGQWQIQNNTLIQSQAEDFDLTIRTAEQYQSYAFTTRLNHTSGIGAGIVFNMPNADNLINAHLARFFPDGAFVWGYFDEQDNFTGQGFLPAISAIDKPETITVIADGQTYSLILNDIELVRGVPLISTRGYVGMTTSESTASFDLVEVRTPAVETVIPNTRPNEGDWRVNGNVITQGSDQLFDYHRSLGVYGEVFSAQVVVELPNRRSNAQGGLIFHSPETQDIRGAHWVRIANDGSQLVWGVVNNDLEYLQMGTVNLDTPIGDSRLLAVQVRANNFDILVDNKIIEQGIALQRSGGWLGLSAFGGPIQFVNFKLSLTTSAQ